MSDIHTLVAEWYVRVNAVLLNRLLDFMRRGLDVRRPEVRDIFERVLYIPPDNIVVVNHLRKHPTAVFNPGATILGNELLVFPRIIFDYYSYTSSIGVFKLDMRYLESINDGPKVLNDVLNTEVVLYPSEPWEIRQGCEDPRVTFLNSKYHVLYTAVSPGPSWFKPYSLQGYALLNNDFKVILKDIVKISFNGMYATPYEMKDSTIINFRGSEALVVTRPVVLSGRTPIRSIWVGMMDMSSRSIELSTLRPLVSIERWEERVGASTNAVKISSNEYLIGWHGVRRDDLIYRNGLAVLSREGELLGITNYVLEPKGIFEWVGDRAGVIFGDGLVKYHDHIYWVGGISDYAIAIFRTTEDAVMESMKWVKG